MNETAVTISLSEEEMAAVRQLCADNEISQNSVLRQVVCVKG